LDFRAVFSRKAALGASEGVATLVARGIANLLGSHLRNFLSGALTGETQHRTNLVARRSALKTILQSPGQVFRMKPSSGWRQIAQ
jgi:hypothetical protein